MSTFVQDLESLLPPQFLSDEIFMETDQDISLATNELAHPLISDSKDKWEMPGSPESILDGKGSWSFSSNGSSNGELSPPTTPFTAQNDNIWDPFYTAAGQIAKLNKEKGMLGPGSMTQNQSWHINQNQNQIRAWGNQQQVLQVQTKSAQQKHNQIQRRPGRNNIIGVPQAAWPPLQINKNHQQSVCRNGSATTVKRECVGTGVFLPRSYNSNTITTLNQIEKSAVMPAKVKGMNMHSNPKPCLKIDFASNFDTPVTKRSEKSAQQKGNGNVHSDQLCVQSHEIEVQLPPEWIY